MDCIAQHLREQDSFSDNDDSYIEIELHHSAPKCFNVTQDHNTNLNNNLHETGFADAECEDYELRISISSTIPITHVQEILQFQSHAQTSPPLASSLLTSSSNSGTFTDSPPLPLHHSSLTQTDQRRLKFSEVNWLFCENRQSDSHGTRQRTIPVNTYNNMDMLHTSTRKQPTMTTTPTTTNGGMMKLLIKFRAIKIPTLLASLVKPRQPKKGQKSSKKIKTNILQCYEKNLVNPSEGRWSVKKGQGRKSKHWDLDNDDSISDSFRSSKRSNRDRVLEIDLSALRGFFGASIAKKGSSKRRSCSTSCNTSPIHEGFSLCSNENSIKAAIAYCKSSFGQASDFSF